LKKISLILVLFGLSASLPAQDPQFTQFYAAPLYLNPAYTGLTKQHRFSANYRNQWPGVKRAYSTYMASYDRNLDNINGGVGGYVMQDVAGTSNIVTTTGALNLAYKVKTGWDSELRGGLNLSMSQKRVDNSKLVFNDQFITGASTSVDYANVNAISYFDMGGGLLFNSTKVWAGVTAKHLNRPNISMTGGKEFLHQYVSVHGGYRIIMAKDSARIVKSVNIAANYRHELKNDQLDLGLNYFYKLFNIGVWYRGIPFKTYPGYSNNESIALLAGLELPEQKIKIGYSYDYSISSLTYKSSSGAHEVSLIYEFASKKKTIKTSNKGTIKKKF
jgi:type IX secretion system PorP/SprF family membrane protein